MARNADLGSHPMKSICEAWLGKIEMALKVREEKFGQYAKEAMNFFDGCHDFMWQDNYARGPGGFLDKGAVQLPTFRITVNKLFEAVSLFGPALYHQNPNALVTPILPTEVSPIALGIDPTDMYGMLGYEQMAMRVQYDMEVRGACAEMKSTYLNWIQRETDKKTHSRQAINEAIITGLGYLETSIYTPPGSELKLPRSTYLSWQDVVVDPDAHYWSDVQWIAIRRQRPVNLTERNYGLPEGDIKGHLQSFNSQPTRAAKKEGKSGRHGQSFDLIEYWEVYSKNGFGDLLHDGKSVPDLPNPEYDFSVFGDFCQLVVAKNIPFPLNCPTTAILEEDPEAIFQRIQWSVPFWYDTDGWPISRLTFCDKPNEVWPISIFKAAIGELRFINWCMSFLADKVAASCTTYIAMLKSAGQAIQKEINGTACPFQVIELSETLNLPIDKLIGFLQAPDFNESIWNMIAQVLELIDKRTGLTELIYGMTGQQIRSATEANIRNENISIRPDDMASRVEDWLSEVQCREMQTARWFCGPQDIEPSVGMMGAMLWQNYIMTGNVDDVVRSFDYRIEAGSARKPNKQNRMAQLQEFGQYALPVFQEFAAGGLVEPFNAYMTEVAKALDINPQPFLVQLPEQQGPSPEEQQAQMEMEIMQAEFELKIAELEAKLKFQAMENEQERKHAEEMHRLEMEQKKAELQMKKQESQAKIAAQKEQSKATAQATKIAARQKPAAGAKK